MQGEVYEPQSDFQWKFSYGVSFLVITPKVLSSSLRLTDVADDHQETSVQGGIVNWDFLVTCYGCGRVALGGLGQESGVNENVSGFPVARHVVHFAVHCPYLVSVVRRVLVARVELLT